MALVEDNMINPDNLKQEKLKVWAPYFGIVIIAIGLFLFRVQNTNLFVLLWLQLVAAFGYIAALHDWKTKKISNNLILAMFAAWVITMMPKLFLDTNAAIHLLQDSLFGFLAGGGLFLLVYIVSRKGLGGGDVKFMAATGLYLGLNGTLSAMFYGILLAGITVLLLLLMRKIGRKDAIPLAPFLYIGILLTVFFI